MLPLANLLNEALGLGLLGCLKGLTLGVLGCQSLGFIVHGLGGAAHVRSSSHGLGGGAVGLVRPISTVVVSVTGVGPGYAASVVAGELEGVACSVTIDLITIVPTVVISISHPSVRNATVVVALELV